MQMYAPGVHHMRLEYGRKTLLSGARVEQWFCDGCKVRFWIKAKYLGDLNNMYEFLVKQHDGFLTDKAMLRLVAEAALMCETQTNQFDDPMLGKVVLKVDFAEWRLKKKGVTYR